MAISEHVVTMSVKELVTKEKLSIYVHVPVAKLRVGPQERNFQGSETFP